MVRTQIYITSQQKQALLRLGKRRRQSLAEMVREAVDRYLASEQPQDAVALLKASAGAWADRDDIRSGEEYVRRLREEWQSP